jgi:resolvase-like protein
LPALESKVGYAAHPQKTSQMSSMDSLELNGTSAQDLSGEKKRRVGQAVQTGSLLEYIREGDTRVVTRLDRLVRSTLHFCQIAADLERKQVNLQVLDQNINTKGVYT